MSDIVEYVGDWLGQQPRVQLACLVNGGWEKWAQVDLSVFIIGVGINTILEDRCYANGQISDFTILPHGNDSGLIVEFKVLNASDGLNAYSNKLAADVTKLNNALVPARQGYRRSSFGIAPATRLIPLLQQANPGQNVNINNFLGFLQPWVPNHVIEPETSANGDVWAVCHYVPQ